MAVHSGIEWTEATWNPTVGCTKVSPGCDRCYAEKITKRFPRTFPNGFDLTLRPELIDLPKHWRRPRLVFVNSMSDLLHADVPEIFIQQVFDVMAEPLLGSLKGINLDGIHWLIGGGESQAGARPAKPQWFRELRAACRAARTRFFLKQLGGHPSKRGGDEAVLDGRRWLELPDVSEQAALGAELVRPPVG